MRNQFTFYASYLEAVESLPPRQQGEVLLAIAKYAIRQEMPENLSGVSKAVFLMAKPTLDSGRRKAEQRERAGGKNTEEDSGKNKEVDTVHHNDAPTGCKEYKGEREYKREIEGEREYKSEKESLTPYSPPAGDETQEDKPDDPAFVAFWEAYPRKEGKGAARKAFAKIPRSKYKLLVPAVEMYKQSEQWNRDNGQYIPHPATWLNQARWEDTPEISGQSAKPRTSNPFLAMAMEMEDDDA